MRRELARLEVDIALCDRCYGPEPRYPARFERPGPEANVLILGERPPRAMLESQERLGLGQADAGTRFLRELLVEAAIPTEAIAVGASTLCRPVSRDLERAVSATACLRECTAHLRELIRILEPQLILLLGATALRSLRATFPADAVLQGLRFPASVGSSLHAGRVWVHPISPTTTRARVSRPADLQRRDWREVGRFWQWIASGQHGPGPRSVLPSRQVEAIVA